VDSDIYKSMTFTAAAEGGKNLDKYSKKRSIKKNSDSKWPNEKNGIPYEIYKAESNYKYSPFLCMFLYFYLFFAFNHFFFVIY